MPGRLTYFHYLIRPMLLQKTLVQTPRSYFSAIQLLVISNITSSPVLRKWKSESVVKISPHLPKLLQNTLRVFFVTHSVMWHWRSSMLLWTVCHYVVTNAWCWVKLLSVSSGRGQHAFSRAYINLINRQDISLFMEKFDGYVFVDSRGNDRSLMFITFTDFFIVQL